MYSPNLISQKKIEIKDEEEKWKHQENKSSYRNAVLLEVILGPEKVPQGIIQPNIQD